MIGRSSRAGVPGGSSSYGDVREDDDADGRVRVDQRLERAPDDAGLVVQDREREVDHDHAGRPGREQAAVARVELARAEHGRGEQDDRAACRRGRGARASAGRWT